MPIVSPKRVKHLARYFAILAIICLLGYGTGNLFFLAFLGPPFFLTYLLRIYGGVLIGWLPNEPFFNNLFLFYPLTIVYFGLVGFQLKNIINERGKTRILILVVFIAFLFYIHFFTFQELGLYWAGSEKLGRLP